MRFLAAAQQVTLEDVLAHEIERHRKLGWKVSEEALERAR